MNQKEKFLKLISYKEFDERRNEFKGLIIDEQIREHMGKIFPKASITTEKLYKEPRKSDNERT